MASCSKQSEKKDENPLRKVPPLRPDTVAFIHTEEIALCDLSFCVPQHAMKPWRVSAVTKLVEALGIDKKLTMVRPPSISLAQLQEYHCADYLHNLLVHNAEPWEWGPELSNVQFSGDCPPVPGIMEYSCNVAAGSIMAAKLVREGDCRTAIHWGGGMHHARCGECSGFCYVNDIVLAILELLNKSDEERVLYIDLDIHHGDGVEEAFYTTDRVFTLSLHKFGDSYFPGTGSPSDIGADKGKYCAMNLALWDGIGDYHYTNIFKTALREIVAVFKPTAIVLQCGADSLAGDRVGVFNLSSVGHARCVEMTAALELPLVVLGGGGYTIRNVVKLWTYETSVLCGMKLSPSAKLPIVKGMQTPTNGTAAPKATEVESTKKRKRTAKKADEEEEVEPEEKGQEDEKRAISDFTGFGWLFHPSQSIHVPSELNAEIASNVAQSNDAIMSQIHSHMRKLHARVGM